MTRTQITGWAFVVVQALLLGLLIVMPDAGHWPVPGWLSAAAAAIVAVGVAVVAVAAIGLGSALTPTPVPRSGAELTTAGLYRLVRHPIYTGVLLIVAGITLHSANAITVLVAAATWGFFVVKSRFEERHLSSVYPGYGAYAETTPRLIPRPPGWKRFTRAGQASDTPRRPGR